MNKIIGAGDYFGIAASILCLLHCLGMPLILTFVTAFGAGCCQSEDTLHRIMAMAVTLPVVAALIPGFIAHRRPSVLVLSGIGLICFMGAVFIVGPYYGETAETALAITGGMHLIAAHFQNRSFCRTCIRRRAVGSCLHNNCN